jgi:hypothetical protein
LSKIIIGDVRREESFNLKGANSSVYGARGRKEEFILKAEW